MRSSLMLSVRSLARSGSQREAYGGFFHPVGKARIAPSNCCANLASGCRRYYSEGEPRRSRLPSSNTRRQGDGESSGVRSNDQDYALSRIRTPRRQDAYPHPRSSYTSSPAPAPSPVEPSRTASETVAFFQHLFRPHISPSFPFPEDVAQRIVTHSSWNRGLDGHNGRLIFLGRRVLNAFLMLFLSSHPKPNPGFEEQPFDIELVCERLLDTYVLGEFVGPVWNLQDVMRWTPAIPLDSSLKTVPMRSSGLYKVRGACVEAALGGMYHQFGGLLTHRIFHTHLLPHLTKEGLGLPRVLVEDVMRLQREMLRSSQRDNAKLESNPLPTQDLEAELEEQHDILQPAVVLRSRRPSGDRVQQFTPPALVMLQT